MNATVKRAIGLGIAAVLILGIVALVFWGRIFPSGAAGADSGANSGVNSTSNAHNLTVVHGVIGSEKKPFFDDPQVKAIFAHNGYDVQVLTAGSRQIATTVDLKGVDFVFPGSAPAAEKISREKSASSVYSPFYSPMAIATFKPIVSLLKSAGIASQDAAGTWHLNVAKYLKAVSAGTRWNQLPGAASVYNSSRSVLISSTDIRQSNSAAMYLAIASYVANSDNIVSSPASQAAIINQMSALFLEQGFSASSSDEPFEDYLSQGIGSKPMVMIYEAQFLAKEMSATEKSQITSDMVLMYPDPTVFSKHTVVPLTDRGKSVGELLQNDPGLAKLAALYGFRPANGSVFAAQLKSHGLAVPPNPVNVIEPPSYETLESMISTIGNEYDSPAPPGTASGTAPPGTAPSSPTPSSAPNK